jgi:hypothetical protein
MREKSEAVYEDPMPIFSEDRRKKKRPITGLFVKYGFYGRIGFSMEI